MLQITPGGSANHGVCQVAHFYVITQPQTCSVLRDNSQPARARTGPILSRSSAASFRKPEWCNFRIWLPRASPDSTMCAHAPARYAPDNTHRTPKPPGRLAAHYGPVPGRRAFGKFNATRALPSAVFGPVERPPCSTQRPPLYSFLHWRTVGARRLGYGNSGSAGAGTPSARLRMHGVRRPPVVKVARSRRWSTTRPR